MKNSGFYNKLQSAFPGTPVSNKLVGGYIIAGFPGIGKSSFVKNCPNNISVLDSDSSHWAKDANWPNNYIDHLKNIVRKNIIAMCSTHKEVLSALKASGLPYVVVYPDRSLKELYLQNYRNRNNTEEFVQLMNKKWDDFITDIETNIPEEKLVKLGKNQYISNILIFATGNRVNSTTI